MALPDNEILNKVVQDFSAKVAGNFSATDAQAEAQAIKNSFQSNFKLSEDDSKQLASAIFYGETAKKGLSENTVYKNLPSGVQNTLILSPENLKRNQNITVLGSVIQIGAIVAGGIGAIIAVIAGAPIAVIGVIAGGSIALMHGIGALINNWNDVFTHGVNYLSQSMDAAAKLDKPGITQFGSLTDADFQNLYNAWKNQGVVEIYNPIKQKSYVLSTTTIKESLRDLISDLNARGISPTPAEALKLFVGWIVRDASLAKTAANQAGAAAAAGMTISGTLRLILFIINSLVCAKAGFGINAVMLPRFMPSRAANCSIVSPAFFHSV